MGVLLVFCWGLVVKGFEVFWSVWVLTLFLKPLVEAAFGIRHYAATVQLTSKPL